MPHTCHTLPCGLLLMAALGCAAIDPAEVRSFRARAPIGLGAATCTAVLTLDPPDPGGRSLHTVPAAAAKARIVVTDQLGFIAGGIPLQALPADRTFSVAGLPPSELKFDIRLTNGADAEVGKAVFKAVLARNAENRLQGTVYMRAQTLLNDVVTAASGSMASQGALAVSFPLGSGASYRITPSVSAVDAAGAPVPCSPTYSIVAGDRKTDDLPGDDIVANGSYLVAGQDRLHDVKAVIQDNCGSGAATVTRGLGAEQVATISVGVR